MKFSDAQNSRQLVVETDSSIYICSKTKWGGVGLYGHPVYANVVEQGTLLFLTF